MTLGKTTRARTRVGTAERRAKQTAIAIVALLAAGAVAGELRKPPGARRWHGRVAGFVPYDFRVPTLSRLRRTWWNPREPRILVDTAFGLGWDVNVAALARLLGRT
jgi:hypothetical protein